MRGLEFGECVVDSPWHRASLREHEAGLETAVKALKRLEGQCRDLVSAAHKLSAAQRSFAESLSQFSLLFSSASRSHFQTDDERAVADSVQGLAHIISQVEEQREKILAEAEEVFIRRLHHFRTERLGRVLGEERKAFEKKSRGYYALLEKHLGLSPAGALKDADAEVQLSRRAFHAQSLDYVTALQSAEERMGFEFMETLSGFLYSFLSFYHVGYRIHEDFKPQLDTVVQKVERAKASFEAAQSETEELKAKMLNGALPAPGPSTFKQGYLQLMEKKRTNIQGVAWVPHFCVFQKESGTLTLIPYSAAERRSAKEMNVSRKFAGSRTFKVRRVTRRGPGSVDRRFCFEVTEDRDGETFTFQACGAEELREWLGALEGSAGAEKSPAAALAEEQTTRLDEAGRDFLLLCLDAVEARGSREEGVYRNCGVSSKVQGLLALAGDRKRLASLDLRHSKDFDIRTITSAAKAFLRNLEEPLMTWALHADFINAAKVQGKEERLGLVHFYVHKLPATNREVLRLVAEHLARLAAFAAHTKMPVGNLAVCFGPSLLRPKDQTLAAIGDIKFANVVVELLISQTDVIFGSAPPAHPSLPPKPKKSNGAGTASGRTDAEGNGGKGDDRPPQPPPHKPRSHAHRSERPERSEGPTEGLGEREGREATSREVRDARRQPLVFSSTELSSNDSLHSSPSPNRPRTGTGSSASAAPRMSLSYAQPYPGDLSTKRMSTGNILSNSMGRVRTLYPCEAGHPSELSFQPAQIITNVVESKEPGWLSGTLNGRHGLIPANYVEFLP